MSPCTQTPAERHHTVFLSKRVAQVSPDSNVGGFAHLSGVDVDFSSNLTVCSFSLVRHMCGTLQAMIGRGAAEGEGKERIRGTSRRRKGGNHLLETANGGAQERNPRARRVAGLREAGRHG